MSLYGQICTKKLLDSQCRLVSFHQLFFIYPDSECFSVTLLVKIHLKLQTAAK